LISAVAGALAALAVLSLAFTLFFTRAVEARYPPVGHRVDIGGGRLHVVETPPQGEERGAVALIHGASGNFADMHVALAERLAAEGFRVYALDRPGHGWSDRIDPKTAAAPAQQARWIRLALQKLGVAEAVVVVHSLAGVLGLAMALDAPGFVRGLVLDAPVSHPWKGGVSWYYSVAASAGIGSAFRWLVAPLAGLALLKSGLIEVFAPNPVPHDYARRTGLALMLRPRHFLANALDFLALCDAARALSPRYREVSVPTAIVMGEEDKLVSVDIHARALKREIPGATLALLPGIGHSPHYAAPDMTIAAILDVDRRAEERERWTSANPTRSSSPA
jgi:pimeloyl-ACP methyl ester carboxylesterase